MAVTWKTAGIRPEQVIFNWIERGYGKVHTGLLLERAGWLAGGEADRVGVRVGVGNGGGR